MKKSLLITLITAAMAMSANAQLETGEAGAVAGGDGSAGAGFGGLGAAGIAGAVIGTAVVGSIIASNDTNTNTDNGGGGETPDPDPECSAGDDLVDGICYNVTNTLTTTVTNGVTTTITVPVTTTYLPTVPHGSGQHYAGWLFKYKQVVPGNPASGIFRRWPLVIFGAG